MREGITYEPQSTSGGLKILNFLCSNFFPHVNELIFCHYFCPGIEIQEVRNSWAFGENWMTWRTASVWENVLKNVDLEA